MTPMIGVGMMIWCTVMHGIPIDDPVVDYPDLIICLVLTQILLSIDRQDVHGWVQTWSSRCEGDATEQEELFRAELLSCMTVLNQLQ